MSLNEYIRTMSDIVMPTKLDFYYLLENVASFSFNVLETPHYNCM